MKDFWTIQVWHEDENLNVTIHPLVENAKTTEAGCVALYVVNRLDEVARAAVEWVKEVQAAREAQENGTAIVTPAEKTIVVPE